MPPHHEHRDDAESAERELLRSLLAEGSTVQQMKLPPALELAYEEYQRAVALRHLQNYWPGVILSITLIGVLVFASGLVPEASQGLALFGFAVFYLLCGIVVISALFAALNPYLRIFVAMSAIGGLEAMHLATMLVSEPNPLHVIAQFGVILVTVAVFTISNLMFRQAMLCWLVATATVVVLPLFTIFRLDGQVFWIYTGGSLIVGLVIGFSHEIRDRTLFLQGRLLLLEKKEIDTLASELADLSRTDPLTALPNRRAFDEALRREWAACLREGESLGLLFIDVDHFKRYNDHYGHPAGDACLASVAGVIAREATRATDVVARYGGEEFVVLLPRTDVEGARDVARQILAAVDRLALPHEVSTTAAHVTVSIGAAALVPATERTSGELVALADAALYRAKSQGRHGVSLADG